VRNTTFLVWVNKKNCKKKNSLRGFPRVSKPAEIVDRLYEAMQARNIPTQEALAARLGVSQQAVSQWIKRPPKRGRMEHVCMILGVRPAWLLDGIGPMDLEVSAPSVVQREPAPYGKMSVEERAGRVCRRLGEFIGAPASTRRHLWPDIDQDMEALKQQFLSEVAKRDRTRHLQYQKEKARRTEPK
jgi:transcriptional regulator with XRE-family HTH domain